MDMRRGMRDKLEKYLDTSRAIEVVMETDGGAVYDNTCFGVDQSERLSDDRYMIFYNQTRSPNGEVVYTPETGGTRFQIVLDTLPPFVNKLIFTVNIDGAGTMRDIRSHKISVWQDNRMVLEMRLTGLDFQSERAIISMEIYRREGWRFAAVARGFNGGLRDLLHAYGGEETQEQSQPEKAKQKAKQKARQEESKREEFKQETQDKAQKESKKKASGESQQEKINPEERVERVELKKGEKVSLRKRDGGALGEILINLNWSQRPKGLFNLQTPGIDLDLGCLYELKNGNRGCVQALGNVFGAFSDPPYILLDGDDRTGAVEGGENLKVNGAMISKIKRILVYTFIYEGAANWKDADGVLTVQCPGSQKIIIRMDEYGSDLGMCAAALLENVNDKTFSVEKIIQFFPGHRKMDEAFHWGLKWRAGRK